MTEGRKDDAGKLRLDLLPFDALELVAQVQMYGATKYGERSWMHVPDGERRYVTAALRHLFSYMQGERFDSESGLEHLGHAATSLLYAISLARNSVIDSAK